MVASIVDAALFNSAIRAVAPVLLAALGGLICQRAGVFNVGLEGMMLVGAFSAVADAIGFRLQGNGLPSQITEVASFVTTLVALVFASRRHSIVELRGA